MREEKGKMKMLEHGRDGGAFDHNDSKMARSEDEPPEKRPDSAE